MVQVKSCRNVVTQSQDVVSGIENEILLPLNYCTISASLKCKQFVVIAVNNQFFFSKVLNRSIRKITCF